MVKIVVIFSLVLAIVFKRFKMEMFQAAGLQTAILVSVAMWIIFGASVFSNFHLLMGAQSMVAEFTGGLDLVPIIMFQIILLLLGFIIDEFIIVLMCSPLFTSNTVSMGYDPICFSVLAMDCRRH